MKRLSQLAAVFLALFAGTALADLSATLIGGREAAPGDFPEVIYISAGSSRCSATVIGPKVILTAAHCVANGGVIQPVDFQVGTQVYQATCQHHPQYRSASVDMALCKVSAPVDVKYAVVADRGPAVGEQVTLSGYGCIRAGGTGGNDGKLRYGEAPVTALPGPSYPWFDTRGSSALCFGDSGGPAFVKMASPRGVVHKVLGVNSRGDIRELSMLTALWTVPARDFFRSFAASEQVDICGINKECGSSDPVPPVPPKPGCAAEARKLSYYKGKVVKWQRLYDQCQASGKPTEEPVYEPEELPYFP